MMPRTNPDHEKGLDDRSFVLLHVTTVPMSLTFLKGQVGYMKERGFRVHAASSPGPDLIAFGEKEHVEVSAVDMPRRITPGRDLVALGGLLRVLRRVRPTIVHAHTPKGGLLGMLAATLGRVPIRVFHVRGMPLLCATGLRRRLLWCADWLACRLAQQVYCVSHSLREEVIREGLCPAAKIKVLGGGSGNGVDAGNRFNPDKVGSGARGNVRRQFGIPGDATVIGFVGRIVRDKGIEELTQAWRHLREEHPDLHLLLVGPFEPQDPVSPQAEATLRADPRVHLAGMDWNTPPLYAAMDVVVLPTYREGFPNVPLEAAAMGLPVVATRIPGCIDAVKDGLTGTLVPAADAGALSRAIGMYVADRALRDQHGSAGRDRVRREFRQDVIWEALHAEYSRMLRDRGLTVPAPMVRPEQVRAAASRAAM
jgi:glycosyltransferase involved in cell wall biosynthesis